MVRVYFEAKGFESGLSDVLIVIYKVSDGSIVQSSTSMTEISTTGVYSYDYSASNDEDYLAKMSSVANKRTSVQIFNRQVDSILKVQKNKLNIASNVLTIFDNDGTTTLFSFNLKDANGNATSDDVFSREPI